MADQQFCLRWNNHQSTLISVFDNLLENNILVDCTLAAEGRYIKAHKVVLCACSPYLELVLSQHSERHPILILKDVKFQELRSMMDYMYKGEVNISQEHLETFLKTAESLQIKGLTDCGNKDAFKDASSSSQMKRHDSSRKPTPTQPVSSTSPVVPFVHSPALSEANVRQMSSSSHIDLQLDASPSSRERSLSPVQRKKKRARRTSQTDSEHYDIPETAPVQLQSTSINNVPSSNPVLSAVNNVGGEHSLNADDISGYAALSTETIKKDKIDCNQDVIVPKTEFFDDLNEDGVEDLTMDDEIDNMDGVAGPSHSAENSNQGYGWPMSGERSSADEMFPNQDVSGIQQDGQEGDAAEFSDSSTATIIMPSGTSWAEYQRRKILTEYLICRQSNWTEEENSKFEHMPGLYPHHLDPTSVRKHRDRSKQESRWECPRCGKRYKYSRGLAMHRRLECGKEPMFHCPYCPQKCHQKGNMVIHIKKKHPHNNNNPSSSSS